jgi:undecaprenyl-diphosphatase
MNPDSLLGALVLGVVQGITEWIPVSSEGAVATTYTLLFDRPVAEAVRYGLWLHLGTAAAAVIYFRKELYSLAREVVARRSARSPVLRFLVVATAVSAVVGLPVLLLLDEVSSRAGGAALALIGVFLIVTGLLQLYQNNMGTRSRDEADSKDAALTGVAQGLSVLPGFSRSGSTIAVLLARKVSPKEAMVLSFLLSIPASIGAAVFAGADAGLFVDRWALVGLVVAGVVGLATLKLLVGVAARVNFGKFVLIAGVAIIAAAVWEILR